MGKIIALTYIQFSHFREVRFLERARRSTHLARPTVLEDVGPLTVACGDAIVLAQVGHWLGC